MNVMTTVASQRFYVFTRLDRQSDAVVDENSRVVKVGNTDREGGNITTWQKNAATRSFVYSARATKRLTAHCDIMASQTE